MLRISMVCSLLLGTMFMSTIQSCSQDNKPVNRATVQLADSAMDNHTYSNVHEIRTKHLDIELDVNFDNKTIYGIARHHMQNVSGTDTAIFDIKGIEIQKVTIGVESNEKETDFVIGAWDKDSIFGQPLLIKLKGGNEVINIYYKTTEASEALDWLDASLTGGKKHPFLYTQGQAILTRTWIPIQDSPGNRLTYTAKVKVPDGVIPVMSADHNGEPIMNGTYHFSMKQPIPCYLIALAVGDLQFKDLGGKCGVFAEPGMLQQCADEFRDLPKMMSAAEELYGTYQWGRYDVIVLPYSFPFGGMENPKLTFLNPTIIAGDRSLVSVVAHELAHSWSGNLVTNATWNDFWLNEGFTVYFENRIMEKLYGPEIADMLLMLEHQELVQEMKVIEKSAHPEDSRLKLNLKGRNPDDGLTSIAYVKGAYFLKTLEHEIGRDKFDVFVKSYFHNFQFKTVTTEQFINYLNGHLLDLHQLDFNTNKWIYGKGLPKNCLKLTSSRFRTIKSLARKFARGENIFAKQISYEKVPGKKRKKRIVKQLKRTDFIAQEWQEFIRQLPRQIPVEQLELLDQELNFKNWGNAEIMYEWYLVGIRNQYDRILPYLENFLCKVGRRKYLMPLYEELAKTPENLLVAKEIFGKAEMNYHAVSRNSVRSLLYGTK